MVNYLTLSRRTKEVFKCRIVVHCSAAQRSAAQRSAVQGGSPQNHTEPIFKIVFKVMCCRASKAINIIVITEMGPTNCRAT